MKKFERKLRSPLRYPGGKSRATKHLVPMIEDMGVKEMLSPFFGGGSIELELAARGVRVHGYDLFRPVVCFWQSLLKRPDELVKLVRMCHPLGGKEEFKELQEKLREGIDDDPLLEAAVYYILNRSSFSGTVLSGGYSQQAASKRFTESSIQRLEHFKTEKNLTVRWADFRESLAVHPDEMFVYADPPYILGDNSNLYGDSGNLHREFDHVALFELLKDRPRWMLSYNNCYTVRQMYKDFKFYYPDWSYGMGNDKESKEILIVSDRK